MMNLFSDEMRRNPFPAYDQIRSRSPVLPVPELDLWMIFDYDGVKRVLTDHDSFSSSMFTAKRGNPEWFIFFDPPRHTKLRALVSRAFTPRVVASLEPRIRVLSRDLLDQKIEYGQMDLAADFAVLLPMMVIAEMLGVPPADLPQFKRWSDLMLNLSMAVPGGAEAAKASNEFFAVKAEMNAYLAGVLAERRTSPKDDLLTKLVRRACRSASNPAAAQPLRPKQLCEHIQQDSHAPHSRPDLLPLTTPCHASSGRARGLRCASESCSGWPSRWHGRRGCRSHIK